MQLHELQPTHKPKGRKRVGRGGKRGTYSGRGIKGQKARAGRKLVPFGRSLIKRYPKLRGYKFKSKIKSQISKIINLDVLEAHFNAGDKVNPQALLAKRLIRRIKGRVPQVKILGEGKLTKAFIIENCQLSKKAKKTIEKAKGRVLSLAKHT